MDGPTATFGFDKIDKILKDILRTVDSTFHNNVMDVIAKRALNLIREKAPKSSGSYARSWKIEKKGKDRKIVTDQKDLYIILEFRGAEPHDIEAKQAKALHYFDENGEEQFYVKVSVNGFDNIPHVRPAIKQLAKDMRIIVKVAAGIHYPQIFGNATKTDKGAFKNMGGSIKGSLIDMPLRTVKVRR